MTITVSAPGKLMLLGEHAVVYDRPCLVTSVGQRLGLQIERLNNPDMEMDAEDVKLIGYKKKMNQLCSGDVPKSARFVEFAVRNFVSKFPFAGGVKIKTKSEFSSLFGFGSSSASAVCTVKALSQLFKINLSNKEVFDISYKTVLDIQGKGSGFDVAAAIFGGTLYFFTGGKIIEPLNIREIPMIVGYTGIKADTSVLMSKVANKAKEYGPIIEAFYSGCAALVELAKDAILDDDWGAVGEIMNFNQGYLEGLGVSSKKLAIMIHAAREAGAYGAKLSGAGGGDCMIAIVAKDKRQDVMDAITEVGGEIIDVATNVEGVRLEDIRL